MTQHTPSPPSARLALPGKRRTTQIGAALLSWYDAHARILPWRIPPAATRNAAPDPYRVWLSEIMLQQTTVATVQNRYRAFLDQWPTLQDLAAAPIEDILREWAGLGYYARARNLHKCAQKLATDCNGIFPDTPRALQDLPGIGPYTAAAIAAIAFDKPATVIDVNIERIIIRLFAIDAPPPGRTPAVTAYAAHLTPTNRPGDHAQALMDIGAAICTPQKPGCHACPLRPFCLAATKGVATTLPVKAKKPPKPIRHAHIYVATRRDGAILTEKRPEKGLLGGMTGLPTHQWEVDHKPSFSPPMSGAWVALPALLRHSFTHFHLDMTVWHWQGAKGRAPTGLAWTKDAAKAGLPTVFAKALKAVTRNG